MNCPPNNCSFGFRPVWLRIATLAVVGVQCAGFAQFMGKPPPEEPQWAKLRFTEISAGVYANGDYETSRMLNTGSSSTYSRMFVGPTIGLGFAGSIYHPNFFQYQINSQNAVGWGNESSSADNQSASKELEYLGFFQGTANFFAGREPKPFATSLFANYDHTYRTYDFFNQVQEDVWRYGLTTGYSSGPVPVQAGYWHRDQITYGSSSTHSIEDSVNFNLRNNRKSGSSGLDYGYNTYNRTQDNQVGYGTDQIISLYDTENFGHRNQYRSNLNGSYSQRDDSSMPSKEWIASGNLTAEHSDTLTSRYNLNYDNYSSGSFNSQNYTGDGALTHQLYESLNSTLLAQGSYYEFTDGPSSSQITRYGGGLGENYSKNLNQIGSHKISIYNSFIVDHANVDNTGTFTVVNDERHSFAGGGGAPPGSFFLNQPRVIETTIVVTDLNHTQPPYALNTDYQVSRNGLLTLVERIPGGRIGPTETVLVSYRALASPSGEYSTLTEAFRFRVSLWNEFVGLYTRVSLSLNNAPADLYVQNLRDYAFGVDFKFKENATGSDIRAGAEYELYDSDLSTYYAYRLFETFAWDLSQSATLALDFNQSWTTYEDSNREEQWYMFITRFHQSLNSRLGFDVEGGVSIRRGPGVDQTLGTCRPGIQYTAGKTSIKAGYDYEYNLFLDTQEQRRNMFYIRAKRVF